MDETTRQRILSGLDDAYCFALRLARGDEGRARELVEEAVAATEGAGGPPKVVKARLLKACWRAFKDAADVGPAADGGSGAEPPGAEGTGPRGAGGATAAGGEAEERPREADTLDEQAVLEAVDSLPAELRAALTLSDVTFLDYRRAAEVLGVERPVLVAWLREARAVLRRALPAPPTALAPYPTRREPPMAAE